MLQKINLLTVLPILFFLSGSAGLIYEVIWTEILVNLLGSSAIAVNIILASFMGGLALGSYTIGKKADSWNDGFIVKLYILIEIGIGIYALLFPSIVLYAEKLYMFSYHYLPSLVWSSIFVKSFFSLSILIIPTFLMGGTLPLISKFLSRNWEQFSKNISLLYALNTAGAIIGTLCAGFYLLQYYGISGASLFAASLNFLVAGIFFIFHFALQNRSKKKIEKKKSIPKKNIKKNTASHINDFTALLLVSYFLSGAAAMFYQVTWTRALSLVLGTSTYAFTTMLATFLFGIALGSLLYRFLKNHISRTSLYIGIQFFIIITVLVSSLFFYELPLYYLSLRETFFDHWEDIHHIRFLLAALVMLLPTLGMGLLFPIVCDLIAEQSTKMADIVGKTYAINAIGAMIGALIAGLLVIPTIGLQYTIYVGVFLNSMSLLIVMLQSIQIRKKTKIVGFFGVITVYTLFILLSPKWSPLIMSSGVYTYANNYFFVTDKFDSYEKNNNIELQNSVIWEAAMKNFDLLYYKDGMVDTVAVMKNHEGIISLMVNGKVDASAKSDTDVATQIMIGQLPLLLHKNPQEVFLVGYASGITAGSILSHPIQSLEVAEISPSVVEASQFFTQYNNNPLADPRMNLHIKDARHMLMVSSKKYDIIVSQPSNPWIKGQSALFAREWYEIVKKHLHQDGLFMQWLPAYNISEDNLKIIINTLQNSFPTVTLWSSSSVGDLIILASKEPKLQASYANMIQRASNPSVATLLQKISLPKETLLQNLFLKSTQEIKTYLNDPLKKIAINSDDKLITEYTAPKNMINDIYADIFIKPSKLNGDENSLQKIIPDLPLEE